LRGDTDTMTYKFPVSGCTIIRDAMTGAFCLFESMATMLPLVDDMHVMDMGSTDRTLDLLYEIAFANKRIHIHEKKYVWENPIVLANASNDVITLAQHDNVLFWQADEIWHENLVQSMFNMFALDLYNMIFWRYQLRDNFQKMHWLPHLVHRVGNRKNGMFEFVGDGMNTKHIIDVKVCGGHHGGWPQWSGKDPISILPANIPTQDMILDVCSLGAFRDNLLDRRRLHFPLWGESHFTIEGVNPDDWQRNAMANEDWTKTTTPFSIPKIMMYHVGKTRYHVRPELIETLKKDREYIECI